MADTPVGGDSVIGGRQPVAVDAMGGDHAPDVVVEGALLAAQRDNVPVLLVGDPDKLGDVGDLKILPATQVVAMDADPATSVRKLKDSSIVRAAEAVRDGHASSLLSAGNTGAAMAASLLRLGRIKGVSRPAIAVPFPVLNSTPTTLLDCGANPDCQPEWLVQFARMGTAYARQRFNIERPRVGVLTIGEEAGKGNALVKAACALLEEPGWAAQCDADYVGNVEGGDLMAGVADVIVCDGFTGNVTLKSLEGFYDIFRASIADAVDRGGAAVRSELESATAASTLAQVNTELAPIFHHFNAKATGAAMLLGTRGVTLISHGSSSANTIANAIRTADEMAHSDVLGRIREAVEIVD